MKKDNSLHELICSLSASEKRYVKIYLSNNALKKGSNYINLFDAVEQIGSSASHELYQMFSDEFSKNQFSVTKHLLYSLILKALEHFHSKKDIEQQIRSGLTHVRLLYEKSLFQHAIKICKRLYKQASENELLHLQLKLKQWEAKIILKSLNGNEPEKTIDKIFKEINHLTDLLQAQNKLLHVDSKLLTLVHRGGLKRNVPEIEKLGTPITEEALSDFIREDNFRSKYLYHHSLGLYQFSLGDKSKSYQHRKDLVELFDRNSQMKKLYKTEYISALSNYLLTCHQSGDFETFFTYLSKIRSIKAENKAEAERLFTLSYTQELLHYYTRNKHTEVEQLVPDIQTNLAAYGQYIPASSRLLFNFTITGTYIQLNKPELALNWNKQTLDYPGAEKFSDIYLYSLFYQLMIYYELEDYDSLWSSLKSVYRKLSKQKEMYRNEELFLEFFKNLLRNADIQHVSTQFGSLYDELLVLSKSKKPKQYAHYFHFIDWLKKRVQKQALARS